MYSYFRSFSCLALVLILIMYLPGKSNAQSTLDCSLCHSSQATQWALSNHAATQDAVAGELAEEWAGLPPDSVILGSEAENCIACHGATAIVANDGMTETQAMAYFFSTTNGNYTADTHGLHSDEWPSNACTACHDVPGDHPTTMPTLALFNSPTAGYTSVNNASILCGQCHGTLRYEGTDHRRQDAWLASGHGYGGQADVAGELAEEWAGATPEAVIGEEDCIACHAPTSVLTDGGMSEAAALELLFTTENGLITANTGVQNTTQWPEVACTSCHNQHNPEAISYFNSETRSYDVLASSQILCGQCHGDLRFPDTDHLSYNIALGSGGIDVADLQTMPGIQCVDCHMHVGDEDDTNASMFGGHLWSVSIEEEDASESSACTSCHTGMDASAAEQVIENWQSDYADLDLLANTAIEAASAALEGSTDATLLNLLAEAEDNLAFAEGDESGGVHNHNYVIALLNSTIEKANTITSIGDVPDNGIHSYKLFQNFPNPFNPITTISYTLPEQAYVNLTVYDVAGREIAVLAQGQRSAGNYEVVWNALTTTGRPVDTGVYFTSITAGNFTDVIKMIYLR